MHGSKLNSITIDLLSAMNFWLAFMGSLMLIQDNIFLSVHSSGKTYAWLQSCIMENNNEVRYVGTHLVSKYFLILTSYYV